MVPLILVDDAVYNYKAVENLKYMYFVEEGGRGLFDYITTLLSENEGCVKGGKSPFTIG